MTLKKFSTSFLTVAGFLAVIAVAFLSGNFGGVKVAEAASYPAVGYAWSDNIGWIQFNTGKSNPVMYDDLTGQFSGYAWSDNIGWVYFGPDIIGKITKQWAKANTTTSPFNVEGWAIAYRAIPDKTDVNAEDGQTLGGWDGWMRFDNKIDSPQWLLNPAKIDLTDGSLTKGDLSGYVWGSDVVGWVSLSCKEGGPTANNICNINDDGTVRAGGVSNYKVSVDLPNNVLSVTCSASPSTANVGDSVTFTANASGGSGTYNFYTWSEDTGSNLTTKTAVGTFITKYPAVSTNTVKVAVEDSIGNSSAIAFCPTVTVSNGGGPYTLTVKKDGSGTGTVVSSPSGINCGTNCLSATYDYVQDTSVELTATKDGSSKFAGWSGGGCSGTGGCTVTMDNYKTVTATFDCEGSCVSGEGDLKITIKGRGTVSGSFGDSCVSDVDTGKVCEYSNLSGLKTLTAKATFGWVFTGWKEDCSGIAKSCVVNMDEDRNVTATFSKVKIIEI